MREFRASDGAAVRAFWEASASSQGENPLQPPGHSLAAFAERNLGLFLIALDERGLAATALGGWDGRRAAGCITLRCVRISAGTGSADDWSASSSSVYASAHARNLIVWDDNAAAMDFWTALGYRHASTVEFEKEL